MNSPSVSGAQTYQELCMAAKNEEKRLADTGADLWGGPPDPGGPQPVMMKDA